MSGGYTYLRVEETTDIVRELAMLIVEPGITRFAGPSAFFNHLRARRKTRRVIQRCYRM